MKTILRTGALFLCCFINCMVVCAQTAPANSAATVDVSAKQITVKYNGKIIFNGNMSMDKEDVVINQVTTKNGNAVDHVIKFTPQKRGDFTISGIITASEEAFPCAVDPVMEKSGDIVRSSVGQSHSLLNRAVYDRKWDWVLDADHFSKAVIVPESATATQNTYKITISGNDVSIRFRPRYYQYHRGLDYYEPWTFSLKYPSIAGWCSWFAYMSNITEEDVKRTTDIVAEKLKPFGYEYIQIDDGYQQPIIGFPDTWLKANDKFPSGLGGLAQYIRSKGMKPGIWNNVSFADKDGAFANKNLFVQNEIGEPAYGRWVGYSLNGNNPEALNKIIRPVFKGFSDMGWQYFKIDALRHLRYEGYNSYSQFFDKKKGDRVAAFRNVVKAAREEVGKDNFILACWGARPELIGLIDACRIGTDGYYWQTLAQYNSFNNVVWLNDPDHVELTTKYAYRDCMLTSMTGSLLMLTDKPEYYLTGNIEPAITAVPILPTKPGQLYDVDPSKSMYLNRINSEMSGSGARLFDAGVSTPYDLFLQEINMPYENWMMLGRVGESRKNISFNELGLHNDSSYLVYEFWSKSLRGVYKNSFTPGAVDTFYNCQLFCIRALQNHPQLLATNRHISCGAQELKALSWSNKTLRGTSVLPANFIYSIHVYEPDSYTYSSFKCNGATFLETAKKGNLREIKVKVTANDLVNWEITYQ